MMKEKYETLPLTTLKELAKARGLKGISTMKKAQVIELMLQEDEKEQEKEKQEKRETVKEMSANTGDKEIHDIDRLELLHAEFWRLCQMGSDLSEVIIIFQEIMISIFRRLRSVDSI